jgi:hypothetical protein
LGVPPIGVDSPEDSRRFFKVFILNGTLTGSVTNLISTDLFPLLDSGDDAGDPAPNFDFDKIFFFNSNKRAAASFCASDMEKQITACTQRLTATRRG